MKTYKFIAKVDNVKVFDKTFFSKKKAEKYKETHDIENKEYSTSIKEIDNSEIIEIFEAILTGFIEVLPLLLLMLAIVGIIYFLIKYFYIFIILLVIATIVGLIMLFN